MIDGERDGLRCAAGGAQDQLVLRLLHAVPEAGEDFVNGELIVFLEGVAVAIGDSVAVGAFVEVQLVDVARQRGLGYVESAAHEFAAELVLTGDGLGGHQEADRVMTFVFAQDGFAGDLFVQTKNRGQLPGSSPRLTMYKNTALMYKYSSGRLSSLNRFIHPPR